MYYVVLRGRKPGIYHTWTQCAANIKKFKGALFKSFKSKQDAIDYFHGTKKDKITVKTPTDAIVIYTDGSCKGNRNVAHTNNPAGWGFVATENGKAVNESYGPVIIDKRNQEFLGAEVMSNNTAELSAIGHAFKYVLGLPNDKRKIIIRYDSKYAAHSIMGLMNGSKNVPLIKQCRVLYEQVKKGRTVEFQHVKGHSNDFFNDRADELANLGATKL